jgi:hypothetical protein
MKLLDTGSNRENIPCKSLSVNMLLCERGRGMGVGMGGEVRLGYIYLAEGLRENSPAVPLL